MKFWKRTGGETDGNIFEQALSSEYVLSMYLGLPAARDVQVHNQKESIFLSIDDRF